MNTVKKEYEAPQVETVKLPQALDVLIHFSAWGDIEEIGDGGSDW